MNYISIKLLLKYLYKNNLKYFPKKSTVKYVSSTNQKMLKVNKITSGNNPSSPLPFPIVILNAIPSLYKRPY